MDNNEEKLEKTAETVEIDIVKNVDNAAVAESGATVVLDDIISFVPKEKTQKSLTVVFDGDTDPANSVSDIEEQSEYIKQYEKAQTERADEFTEKIYSNLDLNKEISDEDPVTEEKPKTKSDNFIIDCVEMLVFAVIFVVALFTFGVRNVFVDGESMYPTLHDKDMLLITDVADYNYGDIIVFIPENYRNDFRLQKPFIKRVIALEGDKVYVDYIENIVYVNDVPIDEPYIGNVIMNSMDDDTEYPIIVPENHIFFMGDNRNGSWDSRAKAVGTVDERHVMGKVILRLFPFESFGRVE